MEKNTNSFIHSHQEEDHQEDPPDFNISVVGLYSQERGFPWSQQWLRQGQSEAGAGRESWEEVKAVTWTNKQYMGSYLGHII